MAGHGSAPPPDRANHPGRRVDRDDAWERPAYTGPAASTSGYDAAEAQQKADAEALWKKHYG